MAQALPTDQNELENQLEQGVTTVASVQTMRDRYEEAHPEPTEDRRPFGYGPCRVCNANKICVFFTNCRHLACCYRCSNECSLCPICGQRVIERLRVFEPN